MGDRDHNQAAPNLDIFQEHLRRAKSFQERGTISVAEALAFFKGANLPTDILMEIADDNPEGVLVWDVFKMAVKLTLRCQQKQLKRERGGGGVKEDTLLIMATTHDTSAATDDDVNRSKQFENYNGHYKTTNPWFCLKNNE